MTKPDEVTVTDEQVRKHIARMHGSSFQPSLGYVEIARRAMQELIAARVPDAKYPAYDAPPADQDYAWGHNALRDRILKGSS